MATAAKTGLPRWLNIDPTAGRTEWSRLKRLPWEGLWTETRLRPPNMLRRAATRERLRVLFERTAVAVNAARSDLRAVDWTAVSNGDLVELLKRGLSWFRGLEVIRQGLPANEREHAGRYFYETLGLKGLLEECRGAADDSIELLVEAHLLMGLLPVVWKEIGRRGERHIGFVAAVMCLCIEGSREGDESQALQGDAKRALEILVNHPGYSGGSKP